MHQAVELHNVVRVLLQYMVSKLTRYNTICTKDPPDHDNDSMIVVINAGLSELNQSLSTPCIAD